MSLDMRIVMSSAYVTVRSDMYMLKSVGESSSPCGTPVFMLRYKVFVFFYSVNCFRPLK